MPRTFLQQFDFSKARSLAPQERMDKSVGRIEALLNAVGHQRYFDLPLVPNRGASEEELQALEEEVGAPLPSEYRSFLRKLRYLTIDDGLKVWGLDWAGSSYGTPWLSEEHQRDTRHIVFGDFWRFADGDQFLFPIGPEEPPVLVYLHECGPAIEQFAPSFSLALWRLAWEEESSVEAP